MSCHDVHILRTHIYFSITIIRYPPNVFPISFNHHPVFRQTHPQRPKHNLSNYYNFIGFVPPIREDPAHIYIVLTCF